MNVYGLCRGELYFREADVEESEVDWFRKE